MKYLILYLTILPALCHGQLINSISGSVVNDKGKGIEGAEVKLEELSLTTVTNNKGVYAFPVKNLNLSSGQKITVTVFKSGFEYYYKSNYFNARGIISEISLSKKSGFYLLVQDSSTNDFIRDVTIFCTISDEVDTTNQHGVYFIPVSEKSFNNKADFTLIVSKYPEYEESKKEFFLRNYSRPFEIKMIRKKNKRKVFSSSFGNRIGIGLNAGKIIGKAADEKEAKDFPLGTGFGVSLSYQHFFRDSTLAYSFTAGFLQWVSEGTLAATGAVIKNKMNIIPLVTGLKYYRNHFYAGIETGGYIVSKTGLLMRHGTDPSFLFPNNDSYGTNLSFGTSPYIGYERKLNKNKFIDVAISYSRIFQSQQSSGFIGVRAACNLFLKKIKKPII